MDRAPDGNMGFERPPSTIWDDKTVAHSASASNVSMHSEPQPAHHDQIHEKGRPVTQQGQPTPTHLEHEAVGEKLEPSKSRPSINNAAAIPNGGLTAWLQVLGAFFLFFNTWYVSVSLVAPSKGTQYSLQRFVTGLLSPHQKLPSF